MPTCETCGAEHELLEPGFRRPDAYLRLADSEQQSYTKANSDLCRIDLPAGDARHFVRAVLPVSVSGYEHRTAWGIWVEVSEFSFNRVLELWSDSDQHLEPPMPATIANSISGYPETEGLGVALQLAGPTTRPQVVLPPDLDHPFANECRVGVSLHRASEWLLQVKQ